MSIPNPSIADKIRAKLLRNYRKNYRRRDRRRNNCHTFAGNLKAAAGFLNMDPLYRDILHGASDESPFILARYLKIASTHSFSQREFPKPVPLKKCYSKKSPGIFNQ